TRECVDGIIKVSTDEICAAIKDIFEDTRSISEPSGALALAGLKKHVETRHISGRDLIAVVSGANVNFDRLRHISEQTEIGEKREILLCVTIPEEPGSFGRFCGTIGKRSITEFNYRYASNKSAHVLVGVQTAAEGGDREALIKRLRAHYKVVDLTENEVAVLHVRHMVGGHAPGIDNERLFRFEFPERPGALLRFLNVLGDRFNISMFHYRNHGSAYGRVLAGIQVPDADMREFKAYLGEIGYPSWEETANPAYRMFLA
ncbi:MAG: threonine ammonia-lyase, biosynthetic, partial [Pseudomonadales bacterium]|nr:threonine ammonia-lyase, biosynthetic [Pseudomonadales bacterium]